MKNATCTIFIALLAVGCSTWTPKKTVTLHDVDAELASSEGADLRYLATPAPKCDGYRGCRNTVSSTGEFYVYQWAPLCDGRYCASEELKYVDVARAAAQIAFAAEQLAAAEQLIRGDSLTREERFRYEEFVERTRVKLPAELAAVEDAWNSLAAPEELEQRSRDDVEQAARTAHDHLLRARALMRRATPRSQMHAWK